MNEPLDIVLSFNINKTIRNALDNIDISPDGKYKDESHFIRVSLVEKLRKELGVDTL